MICAPSVQSLGCELRRGSGSNGPGDRSRALGCTFRGQGKALCVLGPQLLDIRSSDLREHVFEEVHVCTMLSQRPCDVVQFLAQVTLDLCERSIFAHQQLATRHDGFDLAREKVRPYDNRYKVLFCTP